MQLQVRSGGTHNSCFAPQFPRAGGPPVSVLQPKDPFEHLVQGRGFVCAIQACLCISIIDKQRRSAQDVSNIAFLQFFY